MTDALVKRRILRRARNHDMEAVLQIQDLAILPLPYYTYQDMSFGALRRLRAAGTELTHFPALSERNLVRREHRQHEVYARAAGILTMSAWLADQLVLDGLDRRKIHVVHPGINSPVPSSEQAFEGSAPSRGPFKDPDLPRTLLFLGRDFVSKGGDLVLDALRLVRRRYRSDTRLVVAGPRTWPLPHAPPDDVIFLGEVSQTEAAALVTTADLLAMPSRFEGFGIVLAEALVAGLPCVGRRAYAMPEIIDDGVNGSLIQDDGDASALADVICSMLEDRGLYERAWEGRADAAAYWSWDRAAGQVLDAISKGSANV